MADEPKKADDVMTRFAADQVAAVKVLREERAGDKNEARETACYLAMQFLDHVNGGSGSRTVADVIRIARQFEVYLTE